MVPQVMIGFFKIDYNSSSIKYHIYKDYIYNIPLHTVLLPSVELLANAL